MSLDEDGNGAAGGRGEFCAAAHAAADARGVVTGWSEQAQRLLGHPPSGIVGHPVTDLVAPPDRERTAALCRTDPPSPWRAVVAAQHQDGHRLDMTLQAVPLLDGQGRAAQWNLTLTPGAVGEDDIAAQLLEWAFAQSPIATSLHDRERRVRRANDAMTRVAGRTEVEMRGRLAHEITPGLARAQMLHDQLGQVLRTGEPFQQQETVTRVPGEPRLRAWTLNLSPLKDAAGVVQGVSTTTADVTEQYLARQRLSVLSEMGTRIGTTLDVDRTAEELTELAVPGFADFVTVDLLESVKRGEEPVADPAGGVDGTFTLWRSAQRSVLPGCPESVIVTGQIGRYPTGSPPARSLATGNPALFQVDDPEVREWLNRSPERAVSVREHGIHSLIVAPLVARGITLGVALFMRHREPLPFDSYDMLLAGEIASRAAVCVDNARRYTRERATALTLQRSLLPRYLPPRPAIDAASRYLPAGSRAGVGGDWFDVIPLSGARVGLVVGDVVGHGIRAAATMGRLRTAVRTLADVDLPPDELLTHLDDLVTHRAAEEDAAHGEGTVGDVGASCLYAVYDPVSRRCTLARAGHPAPALRLPGGTTRFLDLPPGPPLGLGGLPFESTEVALPEGSVLALYTDGLIRSRGRDADGGPDRLQQLLARSAASLDAVCDTLLDALVPDPPTDDVALLLVRTRVLDARQVATWDLPADPAAVAGARAGVARQLAQWGLQDASFVTELVASELVTNAIRHADAPIQLRLIHERSLICEVSDASSTAPHLRRARVYDEGGRGLLLVAQLTQAWGTRQTTTGKTIWAEQPLPV